jgi:hypothetical protein
MRGRSGSPTWQRIFAAGLLFRPILIVPMAPGGPLGGSTIVPIALASVFAGSLLLAVGVAVGNRPAVAFGIFTAVAGVPLALVGATVGLPMPWPLILVGYNGALAAVGARVLREVPHLPVSTRR